MGTVNGTDERDLEAFFGQRLDETEATARLASGATGGNWLVTDEGRIVRHADTPGKAPVAGGLYALLKPAHAAHIACHDPASVLRAIAGDRALLLRLRTVRTELQFGPHRGPFDPEGIRLAGELDGLVIAIQVRARRFDDHPDWKPQWMWGA